MQQIDFWFSIGSTYTYLSVMRLDAVAAERGVVFRWHPFNVRELMIEMNNVPFINKPSKAAYMWRDIGRRAKIHGLSPKLPAPYPLADLPRANRVAVIGASDGWCPAYTKETYRRWFEVGEAAGSEPNISASIRLAGADAEAVLARADGPEGVDGLASATDKARQLGIFGSPDFIVDGELFWGDDRLAEALAWPDTSN
jgi:2-hydroxychromene-2-carboxylate isomerase